MKRRDFLKIAGAAFGLTLPALGGYWYVSNRGENPPAVDPYAPEPWETNSSPEPVLIIINEDPAHRCGRFLAEILWAEGLNGFSAVRLADASPQLLSGYGCVLLSAGACSPDETEMLASYAAAGGNLVVFQPDDVLATGLGLSASSGTIHESAALADPRHPLAAGILGQPLSVHVEAGLYPTDGGEVVARLDDPQAIGVLPARSGWCGCFRPGLNIVLTLGQPANPSALTICRCSARDCLGGSISSAWIPQSENSSPVANIVLAVQDTSAAAPVVFSVRRAACWWSLPISRNTFSALDQIA